MYSVYYCHFSTSPRKKQILFLNTLTKWCLSVFNKRFLPKSAPPLHFNIPVPLPRNVLLFYTPSFFLLFYAPILAVNLT